MPRSDDDVNDALYRSDDIVEDKATVAGKCARRVAILIVVAASFSVGLTLIFAHRASASTPLTMPLLRDYIAPGCNSAIYCKGDLLDAVQLVGVFNDSKTFVDCPIKPGFTEAQVLAAFRNISKDNINIITMTNFVNMYFDQSMSYVETVMPRDFETNPAFIGPLKAPVRGFALSVHMLWQVLVRRYNLPADLYPVGSYSAINLTRPFVVPGGRFREFYYWDSWWVLQGLLVSNLTDTARDVVDNFLDLVDTYGFVPNGARTYYLDRSQPPVLPLVIASFVNGTGGASTAANQALLTRAVPLMKKEQDFWWTAVNTVKVTLPSGASHRMFRYNTNNTAPRPESYVDDSNDAKLAPNATDFYRNIAAGAETGWDFSTRWIAGNSFLLQNIATDRVVPVDLNAIMLRGAEIVAEFAAAIGDSSTASNFTDRATLQREAFVHVFNFTGWTDGVMSADFSTLTPSGQYYASIATVAWVPSVAALLNATEKATIAATIQQRLLVAGVKTSDFQSGLQWDGNNAWPPLQYFAREAFKNLGRPTEADKVAAAYIATSYCGFLASGRMAEKYNAAQYGFPGGGGEYPTQFGFGWSNGVLLTFINELGPAAVVPSTC